MKYSSNKKDDNAFETDIKTLSAYLDSNYPVFVVNRNGELTDVNDAFCKKQGLKQKS